VNFQENENSYTMNLLKELDMEWIEVPSSSKNVPSLSEKSTNLWLNYRTIGVILLKEFKGV